MSKALASLLVVSELTKAKYVQTPWDGILELVWVIPKLQSQYVIFLSYVCVSEQVTLDCWLHFYTSLSFSKAKLPVTEGNARSLVQGHLTGFPRGPEK